MGQQESRPPAYVEDIYESPPPYEEPIHRIKVTFRWFHPALNLNEDFIPAETNDTVADVKAKIQAIIKHRAERVMFGQIMEQMRTADPNIPFSEISSTWLYRVPPGVKQSFTEMPLDEMRITDSLFNFLPDWERIGLRDDLSVIPSENSSWFRP